MLKLLSGMFPLRQSPQSVSSGTPTLNFPGRFTQSTLAQDTVNIRFGDNIHRVRDPRVTGPDEERYYQIVDGDDGVSERLVDAVVDDSATYGTDGRTISVPRHIIDLPHFKPGGAGNPFDGLGRKPGTDPADHEYKKWAYPISALAEAIGDQASLPNLQPRGQGDFEIPVTEWDDVLKQNRKPYHRRKTQRNIATHNIAKARAEGRTFDPAKDEMEIRPQHIVAIEDRQHIIPFHKTVIIYIRDYSGSMGDPETNTAKKLNFLMSTWLKYQHGKQAAEMSHVEYNEDQHYGAGIKEVYVLHDSEAKVVDTAEEFYGARQGGGTKIASAYDKVQELIDKEYPPTEWNVYIFHASDGDCFGEDGTESVEKMKSLIAQGVNLIGYFEIRDRPSWFAHPFSQYVYEAAKKEPYIRGAELTSKSDFQNYVSAINDLLYMDGVNPQKKRGGVTA